MDRTEKQLTKKVNKAAEAHREALAAHKSNAECNRLGENLAAALRELTRYKSRNR